MPLESGDYISDLVSTNPPGTDNVSQGDDHLRLIKHVLKTTFPNIDGPVTSSDEELSNLGGGMPIITTYSSPVVAQTHTFGVGKNWYRVYVTGGGGGASSATNVSGSGGAAAGTAIKVAQITSVDATYTVGAGGAVDAAGEDSVFDDGTETVTGGGGPAGLANRDGELIPGIGTGGDINIMGGGPPSRQEDSAGGASYWGGSNANSLPGNENAAFGTGGHASDPDEILATAGIAGVVVIEEY